MSSLAGADSRNATREATDVIDLKDADEIWKLASGRVQAHLSAGNYALWFGGARPRGVDGATFVLELANPFAKESVEARYLDLLRDEIGRAAGHALDVVLVAGNAFAADDPEQVLVDSVPEASAATL